MAVKVLGLQIGGGWTAGASSFTGGTGRRAARTPDLVRMHLSSREPNANEPFADCSP